MGALSTTPAPPQQDHDYQKVQLQVCSRIKRTSKAFNRWMTVRQWESLSHPSLIRCAFKIAVVFWTWSSLGHDLLNDDNLNNKETFERPMWGLRSEVRFSVHVRLLAWGGFSWVRETGVLLDQSLVFLNVPQSASWFDYFGLSQNFLFFFFHHFQLLLKQKVSKRIVGCKFSNLFLRQKVQHYLLSCAFYVCPISLFEPIKASNY